MRVAIRVLGRLPSQNSARRAKWRMPRRHPNFGTFAAILVMVVLIVGVYVGAYFVASEYKYFPLLGDCRYFRNKPVATAFWPMVKIESSVRGREIKVVAGHD